MEDASVSTLVTHSPATDVVDPSYWLDHCEAYRAVGPEGWIGTVRRVYSVADAGATIIVATGLFRPRRLAVPATEVDHVEPWRKRVVLRHDPRLR